MAEMVTLKLSKSFDAIRSRIRRLPKLVDGAMDAQTKKDVIRVIDEYQKGIKRNNFGLTPLSPATIKLKREKGLPKPTTTLYGEGDGEKNSLINALSFRKIKNGYRLVRRTAKHHESDLPLNVLLAIHEHGAIIRVTPRMRAFLHYIGIHLSKNTAYIRIPPRPVVDKAIVRALQKKKKEDPAREVRAAINELIRTGQENMFKKLNRDTGGKSETAD